MLEMQLVWIAVFGALGSLARYGVGLAAKIWLGASFPFGTLAVNLVGSFILALVMTLALSGRVSEELRLAIGVGFCGAFTTFSTFELEVQQLIASGRPLEAFGYVVSSLALGFGAVLLGQWVARL
jgi:fluoride exporter